MAPDQTARTMMSEPGLHGLSSFQKRGFNFSLIVTKNKTKETNLTSQG